METDTKVSIFYGPLSWFEGQLGGGERVYLPDAVSRLDESKRRFIHSIEGQEQLPDEVRPPRVERLVAMSSDYASINEHALTNFVGLVRDLNAEELILHNPPELVRVQVERVFEAKTESYEYPVLKRESLIQFRSDFSDHLVGQRAVRERMLAALYPLITPRSVRPVVLMFFGPSGVGKTETAQFVNELMGGELFRKQFSMYHSEKFASYVFGGAHSEPSFARDLLDRSSGVILIDEFDKAASVFHSAFYEFFDEGVFEDKNYRVRLGPALIICTSNYGSEEDVRSSLGEALYSRFDALIQFTPLSPDEIGQVIDRLIDSRFETLLPEEQAVLDRAQVKDKLRANAPGLGNVRKLGKLIDEVISLMLVRAILGDESEKTCS